MEVLPSLPSALKTAHPEAVKQEYSVSGLTMAGFTGSRFHSEGLSEPEVEKPAEEPGGFWGKLPRPGRRR